jgi:hypothetical protein
VRKTSFGLQILLNFKDSNDFNNEMNQTKYKIATIKPQRHVMPPPSSQILLSLNKSPMFMRTESIEKKSKSFYSKIAPFFKQKYVIISSAGHTPSKVQR